MTVSDSTVAIIGTGNIGSRLAANFAAGGQDFLLADRNQDKARKIAADLGGHAEAVSIDDAVERADVLVISLWPDAFKQLIAQYGGQLAGKVIVDPSNPIGPDGSGVAACRWWDARAFVPSTAATRNCPASPSGDAAPCPLG